jgi:hypothetical protein
MEAVHCQRKLTKVTHALRSPSGFARRLHGRQNESEQQTDDGDDDEQFDKCKSISTKPLFLRTHVANTMYNIV